MILDERTEFADDVAVTVTADVTNNIGDQIPLSVARDLGTPGSDASGMQIVFQVTEAFTSGGAATVAFQVASDASAAIAVDGSQSVHVRSKVFSMAELALGAEVVLNVVPESTAEPYELFLGVQAVKAGGAALTAGKVNAFLTRDTGRRGKVYASPSQYV